MTAWVADRSAARWVVLLLFLGTGFGAGAEPLGAQQPTPLQKSDVVRLLSGGTYTQPEVAAIVRRSCLSFRPTERDIQSFQGLGASDGVMNAIRECAESAPSERRGQASPSPSPPQRQPQPAESGDAEPGGTATLFLSPRQVQVSVGDSVEVFAEVTFGAAPARGIRLTLRRGRPGEGGEAVSTAVTDAQGQATFALPPVEEAGLVLYSVVAPGQGIRGANVVEVQAGSGESSSASPVATAGGQGATAEAEREASDRRARGEGSGNGGEDGSDGEVSVENRGATLEEAERLSRQGRYGRAEALFEALLEEDGRDVDALLGYGRHLTRAARHAEARRVLRRAQTVDSSRADVLMALGFVELWEGEAPAAVRRYRRATELAQEDPDAWRGLARALAAAGEEDQARRASRRARELEGG